MRVIAGTARGRPLRAAEGTRPTADITKGAIFSMLEALAYKRGFEPDEDGTMAAARAWPHVLDLFAGSGALGIEALSRGAQSADFVESSRDAARVIATNLRSTGLDEHARVHTATVEQALARLAGPADLVLVDPPYADETALNAALDALARSGLAHAGTVVVVEQPQAATPRERIEPGLRLASTRRHGQTRLSLYVAADDDAS